MTVLLLALLFSLLPAASSQSNSSSSSLSVSSSLTSTSTSSTGPSFNNNPTQTLTATSLLPVPSYATSSYNQSTIDQLTPSLPGYTYNLMSEPASSRIAICDQQTQYCATAGCATMNANITDNFCNPQTMGWKCTCSSGLANLKYWQSPVDKTDCIFRSHAYNTACQK